MRGQAVSHGRRRTVRDLLYKATQFAGELQPSAEGEVFWVPREELPRLALANDLAETLPVFENDALSELYYYHSDGEWKTKLL